MPFKPKVIKQANPVSTIKGKPLSGGKDYIGPPVQEPPAGKAYIGPPVRESAKAMRAGKPTKRK